MAELREYVIWSFEHSAWWGWGEHGYVVALEAAGLYTPSEAGKIVCNSVLGEEVALHRRTAERNGAPTVRSLWQPLDEVEEDT